MGRSPTVCILCWKPSKTDQTWTGNQPPWYENLVWYDSETSKPPSPDLPSDEGLPKGFYSATPLIPQNALAKPVAHKEQSNAQEKQCHPAAN